jgi:hypothetical protein
MGFHKRNPVRPGEFGREVTIPKPHVLHGIFDVTHRRHRVRFHRHVPAPAPIKQDFGGGPYDLELVVSRIRADERHAESMVLHFQFAIRFREDQPGELLTGPSSEPSRSEQPG